MIAGRYLTGRGRQLLPFGFLTIVASVAGGTASLGDTATPAEPAVSRDASASFAVVELFTSESCPSCPAADRLLSEVGAEARRKGQRILPLAFHVDYWRTGSAADPFSDSIFAGRQRAYAAALDSQDIYTPQMIVNGRVAFVGSERATVERQIKAALSRPAGAEVNLTLADSATSTDTIRVDCEVRGAARNASLQLAVVERNLSISSRHGGRGRQLDNVVRVFKTIPLSRGSLHTVELQLPRGLVRKNASVVGYVQDGRSLAILGASSIDIQAAPIQRVASSD